jgi:hypothetical protein
MCVRCVVADEGFCRLPFFALPPPLSFYPFFNGNVFPLDMLRAYVVH